MDFREFRYMIAVADCQSITKAAAKLYVSQPSLSHLIARVEQELGLKLFDRTAYPIRLTYAGERYVDTARKILMLDDDMRREFMDISEGRKGRITVGIPTERGGYMLPGILTRFKKEFPGIEVSVLEGSSELLIDSVLKGQTNFIIIPETQKVPELEQELIYREELFFIAGHEMVKEFNCCLDSHTVNPEKLSGMPFVLQNRGHSIRKIADSIFKKYQIIPQVVMETHSSLTAATMAAAGSAVTIVPARTVEMVNQTDGYGIYSIGEPPVTWDVVACYRKDAYLDKTQRRFITIAQELWA